MRKLQHRQAPLSRPVVISVTVNIHLDRLFWLMFAAAWLLWLTVGRVGRFLRRYTIEYPRAIVVVAWRRLVRAARRFEQRFTLGFSNLAYGPVIGVG